MDRILESRTTPERITRKARPKGPSESSSPPHESCHRHHPPKIHSSGGMSIVRLTLFPACREPDGGRGKAVWTFPRHLPVVG